MAEPGGERALLKLFDVPTVARSEEFLIRWDGLTCDAAQNNSLMTVRDECPCCGARSLTCGCPGNRLH